MVLLVNEEEEDVSFPLNWKREIDLAGSSWSGSFKLVDPGYLPLHWAQALPSLFTLLVLCCGPVVLGLLCY